MNGLDNSYFQMLLRTLKSKMFKKVKKIDMYGVEAVDYFDWHKKTNGNKAGLERGIGTRDGHYQLSFSIDQAEHPVSQEAAVLCLTVETSDTDMWDTSNPQFIVLINGEVIRALDMNHNYVLLPEKPAILNIALNVYTNTEKPDVFIESWITERNNLVYQLYYRLKALDESLEVINKHNTEVWKIYAVLENVKRTIDLTVVREEAFLHQVQESLLILEEWFKSIPHRDEKEQIIEHVVGHTHIDISWFWTLKQTREKVVRSFSNAVYLLERYPEMTFMSSTPLLYEMLEQEELPIFNKVNHYIANGRWQPEGGMYVESDINLPSGESLIRQILYGKRYFKEKFQHDSKILWLPDCFGFSASLPQIMKKSGLEYFFTSKMNWNEANRLPNDTFYWKGIDGSKVLSQFLTTSDYSEQMDKGTTYNGRLNASQVKGTWSRYQNRPLSRNILQLYGFGDGGGGPTEEMLEYAHVFEKGIVDMPTVKHSTPLAYFAALQEDLSHRDEVPLWDGELYLETHRGVYTTDGRLKKYNRETEAMLLQAEFICVLVQLAEEGVDYSPRHRLERAWKNLLINQFHDILPGSSSIEVHREAVERYLSAQQECKGIIKEGIQLLGWGASASPKAGKRRVALNATSFSKSVVISDEEHDYFLADIPPFGYKTFEGSGSKSPRDGSSAAFTQIEQKEATIRLENEGYIMEINRGGEICRLFSKQLSRELVQKGQPFNQLLLYGDLPQEFDAWNIDEHSLQIARRVTAEATIRVVSNSMYKTEIEVRKRFNQSMLVQTIVLYRHSARIDFETMIDWQEQHVLAKVKFPTAVISGKAAYDIQFGNVERSNHANTSWDRAQFEVCAHKWSDLSEQGYGIALLNNGKYGHSIYQSDMYLTLLRGSQYPAPDVDKGRHSFTYSLLPHKGTFRGSKVYEEAYDLNNPVLIYEDREQDTFASLPVKLIEIAEDTIICEAIKPAENGNGIVLRFYESEGKSSECLIKLNFAFLDWRETDLMEEPIGEGASDKAEVSLAFTPYEIKTVFVRIRERGEQLG